MRLIDADVLKEQMLAETQEHEKGVVDIFLEAVAAMIDEQPTIERKTGKWIKMSDVDGIYWVCSECGEDIPRIAHFNPQFDLFPRLESIDKTYFCPHCGARMSE